MPDERFADHLRHPRGRGHEPAGGHRRRRRRRGVRRPRALQRRRRGRARRATPASRPPAAARRSPPPARRSSSSTARRCSTPRASGSAAIAAELGGLSAGKLHAADLAADALRAGARRRRARRRRRSPAASRRARWSRCRGGVDCAVAALLRADGRGRRASRSSCGATPENDGERSCCSAERGARRPRARAPHGPAAPHARPARRVPRRRRRALAGRARRRADAEPLRALQRRASASTRCSTLADRLGAATLATGHYARRSADGLLRLAADPAKDQTLHARRRWRRATLARLRFPLGELTKPEVRELAARARAAGRAQARLAGPVLPGRHRARGASSRATAACASGPGDVVDRAGRTLGRHAARTRFTVGQRRGLGVGGGGRAALRAGHRRARQHRHRRPARGAGAPTPCACATCACTASRRPVDAVQAALPRPPRRPARWTATSCACASPCEAPAPGQTAVLLRGDVDRGMCDNRA